MVPALANDGSASDIVTAWSFLAACLMAVYAGGTTFQSVSREGPSFLLALPLSRVRLWVAFCAASFVGMGVPAFALLMLRFSAEGDNGFAGLVLPGLALFAVLFCISAAAALAFARTALVVGLVAATSVLYVLPLILLTLYLGTSSALANHTFWLAGIPIAIIQLGLSLAFFLRGETSQTRVQVRNLLAFGFCLLVFPVLCLTFIEFEGMAALDGYRVRPEFAVSPDGKYLAVAERFVAQPMFGRLHIVEVATGKHIRSESFKSRELPLFWISDPDSVVTGPSVSIFEFFLGSMVSIPRSDPAVQRFGWIIDAAASLWSGTQTFQIHRVGDEKVTSVNVPAPVALRSVDGHVHIIGGKSGDLSLGEIQPGGFVERLKGVRARSATFSIMGKVILADFADEQKQHRLWLGSDSQLSSPSALPAWVILDSKGYPADDESGRMLLGRFPLETPSGWYGAFVTTPIFVFGESFFVSSRIVDLDHEGTLFRIHANLGTGMARLFALNIKSGKWNECGEFVLLDREVRSLQSGYVSGGIGFKTDFAAGVSVVVRADGNRALPVLYDARAERRIELPPVDLPPGKISAVDAYRVNGLDGLIVHVSAGAESRVSYVYDFASGEIRPVRYRARTLYFNLKGEQVFRDLYGGVLFAGPDGVERKIWP